MQKKYLFLVFLLLQSHFLFAQLPSETAFAYPAAIKIDGKLDDWKNIEKYPINQFPYGNNIQNKEDFEAFFQVAYSKELQELYFAITIQDQENLLDQTDEAAWNTQDTYNFYFDEKHDKKGSGVILYSFNETFEQNNDLTKSWDKELREQKTAKWENIERKIITQQGKKIIEFKIKINRTLENGTALGIDHMLVDLDTNENFEMITWTNSGGKSSYVGRLGTLILLDKQTELVKLQGKLEWKIDTLAIYPSKIRIYNPSENPFWTNVLVDSLGNFELQLPRGEYETELHTTLMKFENEYKKVDFDNTKVALHGSSVSKFQMTISEIEDIIPSSGILLDGLGIEDEFQVDNFIRTYMDYYQIAGVSLALIDNGEVVFHNTYGYKNYSTQKPVNKRTVFEGASTTKPMFAFAVMRLVERGIIDLDKPLYLYHEAPKDVQDDPNHKLITARMVLSHTTGFPNWAFMNPDGKLNIQFTPGTKYQYSGAGFEYLKDVVVKVTGKDISTILKEEVLDVFEIENTYFKYEKGLEKIKADGHFGLTPTSMNIPENVNTAASLHTDPQSYAKFLIGILNKKGLKKETYQEIFKIQTLTSEKESIDKGTAEYFGLGLFFRDSPVFGKSFGHGGNNGDFKCDAMIYEKEGKGFVIMTNSDKGDAIFRKALYKFLITGKEEMNP